MKILDLMKKHPPSILALWSGLLFAPLAAHSADTLESVEVPQDISKVTAQHIAILSSSLTAQHKALQSMIDHRTDFIVDVQRGTAAARNVIDRELLVLNNTNGKALAALFTAVVTQGDNAAAAPAKLDEFEANVRADVAAGVKLPALSTAKLDDAAKKLAQLAKTQSTGDRLKAFGKFFEDTKNSADKLQKEATDKATSASNALSAVKASVSDSLQTGTPTIETSPSTP